MSTSNAMARPPLAEGKKRGKKKPQRGRPVGDREAKRNEILMAGIRVIADEGFAGASLRKVAEEAGYTTGAITYYFADKEAMVIAIIERMFDGFDTTLDIGDTLEDLKQLFKRWIELNSNSAGWLAGFQLLARARHEPAFAAIYQERYASYRRRFTGILSRLQAAGEVRSDISAAHLADHLGSMADGWSVMLPIEPERFTPRRVDALIDSILNLIRPPAAAHKPSRNSLR